MFEYNLIINLQLFSEEKTEPASAKKRREAREKGQVAKSREIVTAFLLLIAFLGLRIFSKSIFMDLYSILVKFFNFNELPLDKFGTDSIMQIYGYSALLFAKVMAPILLITAFVAIVFNILQVGFLFTLKPLVPKFNKLNPIEGFKRLFSSHSLMELAKSILKISIVGFVVYNYFMNNYTDIPSLLAMSIEESAMFIGNAIINTGIRVAIVLIIISIFDYAFEIWQYEKNLKMTKQEVKDEYKQVEGNPQIKSKIREKQRQLALRRMMAEVPKADVIITNPTHYAVAVKYDADVASAPLVIGKGKDLIAQKIKDIAKEHKIPVVENKPLAQALYKSVDIGKEIPAELYKAVAEVLAFVYSLKNK
ncbi:MAG: flagellar biosynthesis protein FlhB [Bacillota bacterium]